MAARAPALPNKKKTVDDLTQASDANPTDATTTEDQIRMRAYEIYLEAGAPDGMDVEHWLQAESELRQKS